jgi:hypothetical protein
MLDNLGIMDHACFPYLLGDIEDEHAMIPCGDKDQTISCGNLCKIDAGCCIARWEQIESMTDAKSCFGSMAPASASQDKKYRHHIRSSCGRHVP